MSLKEKIEAVIARKDWGNLPSVLTRLTNSEFRRLQTLLREDLFQQLNNEEFWEAFRHFLDFRPQAFMACIHCIEHLADNGTLDFNNDNVSAIANILDPAQRQKLAAIALPYLTTEKLVNQLFDNLKIDKPESRIAILIRENSPLAYYLLFSALKTLHDHHDKCLQCCRFIMKRQDDLSYNMASILRTYFGLTEIQGHLSLKVEQYELSFIESSFENFRFVLEGRRPNL